MKAKTKIHSYDAFERHQIDVIDSKMTYIDEGEGDPVVFMHGNGTFSYLWRNIIPYALKKGWRCLAPDLIGQGDSGPMPSNSYKYVDHYKYIEAWFDAMNLPGKIVLVLHDWGGALGFNWAYHHKEKIRGIAYMETFVRSLSWDDWPEASVERFKLYRSPDGEAAIIKDNLFVAKQMPSRILRDLTDAEMEAYLHTTVDSIELRKPTAIWTQQVPLGGEPRDVIQIVDTYGKWMETSPVPKLFINADPGSILIGRQREYCRSWPNQESITVQGLHFIQEDAPEEIGEAIARFLAKLNPNNISGHFNPF